MKLKSSFILVFISLSLSSLSVAVLAAPVVHKTTTTSEQQEQSSSSITTGSHEDLQYPAVNKGALKDISASVPGNVNHIVAGDQDVTVSNGSPRNLGAPSAEVSVKGTAGGDIAAQRGGPEETDAGVHTSSDNTKLKDLGTISSGGLISDVDNQSAEKTSESEHPHSHDDSEVTSTVNRSRHRLLLTSDNDDYLGTDKAQWMTALANKLGSDTANVYLKDFVLPGSHNSAAYWLKGRNCGFGGSLNEHDMNRKARCQSKSILEQLEAGIRYLDIRVINNEDFDGDGIEYPLHHTFVVNDQADVKTMEEALNKIVEFLDRPNSEEFVVARIKGQSCDNVNGQRHWTQKFDDIRLSSQNKIFTYQSSTHLNYSMDDLKGKLFVDINGYHKEVYKEGTGVGLYYKPWEGNPFDIAENIKNENYPNIDNQFNIWSFFPAADTTSTLLSVGGIKQWDKNFQRNNWLMHSLIAHEGPHVNAILRDYVNEGTNIYHTATQLTLYRIFDKQFQNSGTVVSTLEYVNAYHHKFEHRCPKGWILEGMSSSFNKRKDDRRWKFKCTKVDWLKGESEFYLDGDYGDAAKVSSDINEDIFNRPDGANLETEYDVLWSIGDDTCNRAITGLGAMDTKSHRYKRDRMFYHYSSEVDSPHSSKCHWTSQWKNQFEGDLDWEPGRKNKYIGKIRSTHSNKKEDRRFKFCICTKK